MEHRPKQQETEGKGARDDDGEKHKADSVEPVGRVDLQHDIFLHVPLDLQFGIYFTSNGWYRWKHWHRFIWDRYAYFYFLESRQDFSLQVWILVPSTKWRL